MQNYNVDELVLFGPFSLFPSQRKLVKNGVRCSIGSRALDLLMALVDEAGKVVDKRVLMARAWQNIIVDESNLRVNISVLQKALGEGENGSRYIANIPGRGYSFIAKLERLSASLDREQTISYPGPLRVAGASSDRLTNRMIGREGALISLMDAMLVHQYLTIVGPGGIGKSILAHACFESMHSRIDTPVHYLNLDSIIDEGDFLSGLLLSFDLKYGDSQPIEALLSFLEGKRLTLILDNCDHLLVCVAKHLENIIWKAPRLRILTTSREPIRLEREYVYRLGHLKIPPLGNTLTLAQAKAYPAVEFFVAMSESRSDSPELNDNEVALIVEICHRLDGNPFSIELVAGRVNAYGLQGTLRLLDNTSRLYWSGRRNAVARHQSIEASLDRSFSSLNELEKRLFLEISQFHRAFLFEDLLLVGKLISDYPLLLQSLDVLIAKSLVHPRPALDGVMHYRMNETVRVYARERISKISHTESDLK